MRDEGSVWAEKRLKSVAGREHRRWRLRLLIGEIISKIITKISEFANKLGESMRIVTVCRIT